VTDGFAHPTRLDRPRCNRAAKKLVEQLHQLEARETISDRQSGDRGLQLRAEAAAGHAGRQFGANRATAVGLKIGPSTVHYVRIPVTDHCGPSESALAGLRARIPVSTSPADAWVHFHCHGGDGRTTTFLALYDMLCWSHSNDPLPPGGLDAIACRQCLLFSYCLNPNTRKQPDGSPCGQCAEKSMIRRGSRRSMRCVGKYSTPSSGA
jgi:hypothetical protein